MGGRDYFAEAQVRGLSHGRKHAESAIETALLVCEARQSTEEQLADLADAVDAYRSGQYAVAVALAEAAIERHRTPRTTAIRPEGMRRSLLELKTFFADLQIARASTPQA
jgi:hypothetical protein